MACIHSILIALITTYSIVLLNRFGVCVCTKRERKGCDLIWFSQPAKRFISHCTHFVGDIRQWKMWMSCICYGNTQKQSAWCSSGILSVCVFRYIYILCNIWNIYITCYISVVESFEWLSSHATGHSPYQKRDNHTQQNHHHHHHHRTTSEWISTQLTHTHTKTHFNLYIGERILWQSHICVER